MSTVNRYQPKKKKKKEWLSHATYSAPQFYHTDISRSLLAINWYLSNTLEQTEHVGSVVCSMASGIFLAHMVYMKELMNLEGCG